MILSSLLDLFFVCLFCFVLFSSWELLGGGFDFLCVEATLGREVGGVQFDGEKRLLVFPHVPSLKPPLLED